MYFFLHIILNVIYLIFENAKLFFSGHYCSLIAHANILCLVFLLKKICGNNDLFLTNKKYLSKI